MAVADKGDLKLGEYTLRLDVNAICEAEAETGKSLSAMLREDMGATEVRAFIWAALQTHHPETTILEAGNIIGEVGLKGAMDAVASAIRIAMPKASTGGKAVTPPKPKATG